MKGHFDVCNLSEEERKRIDEFICLSSLRLSSTSCDLQQVAFCFLAARKFSLAQAIELYNNYQNMLVRENLPERIDPFDEDVRQELLSGKFVILNDHEPNGARVAQFFVRLYRSTTNQRALLQSILFQLDATFKRESAMRSGLVLIYDMTDAKFFNIDCVFGIKLFKLLQSSYPVRLRRILILTAPLWFRASFRMMHRFIRDQLPNCVNVLRPSPGTKLDALSHPDFVALRREHYAWLQTALTRTGWLSTDAEQSAPFDLHENRATEPFRISDSSDSHETRPHSIHGEHAETPTPPSVVKRLVRPLNDSVNAVNSNVPTGTTASTRPTTINSSLLDTDMGFSEHAISPLAIESITPTADTAGYSSSDPIHPSLQRETRKINQHRHSAGTESSCSSITSFFSTGSVGVSSALSTHSADCSPTGEQLFQRVGLTALGGSLIAHPKVDNAPLICVSPDRGTWPDDGLHFPRVAPLAEDEIGDQTIRSDRRSSGCEQNGIDDEDSDDSVRPPLAPPSEDSPPSWAIGRPRGRTIHQGPADSNLASEASLSIEPSSCDLNSNVVPDLLEDDIPSVPFTQPSVQSAPLTDPDETKSMDSDTIDVTEDTSSEEDLCEMSENEEDGQDIDLEDYWMTPEMLVSHVALLGLKGLQMEYNSVVRIKSPGSRAAFKHSQNRQKNRYCDVICYDSSRVRLRSIATRLPLSKCSEPLHPVPITSKAFLHRTLSAPAAAVDLVRNYIHANWVDGYRQKNAFICAQGPLFTTVGDFWQMIWDYHVPIVAMIAKVYEADSVKCFPYWPPPKRRLYFTCGFPGTLPPPEDAGVSGCLSSPDDSSTPVPEFEVSNVCHQDEEYFTCSTLRLTHLKTGHRRIVKHFSFSSWPDHGVPQTTEGLLKLLSSVQQSYLNAILPLGYTSFMDQKVPPPPVVVHCSAGIGRTGTYVTADICTKWLADPDCSDHRINIPLTVNRIRSQRYGCVQVAAQYVFCYRVVIDFALQAGFLDTERVQWMSSQLSAPSDTRDRPSRSFDVEGADMTASEANKFSGRMSAAFAELRDLFPPSQLMSIWHALHPKRDHPPVADSNFILIENGCSDSDESAELESDIYAQSDAETECA
ncbi:unnamed protein product [Dicrocoelium dendriticum]|nr:unnamed protein product [Dicrocoelium dendriticum]